MPVLPVDLGGLQADLKGGSAPLEKCLVYIYICLSAKVAILFSSGLPCAFVFGDPKELQAPRKRALWVARGIPGWPYCVRSAAGVAILCTFRIGLFDALSCISPSLWDLPWLEAGSFFVLCPCLLWAGMSFSCMSVSSVISSCSHAALSIGVMCYEKKGLLALEANT